MDIYPVKYQVAYCTFKQASEEDEAVKITPAKQEGAESETHNPEEEGLIVAEYESDDEATPKTRYWLCFMDDWMSVFPTLSSHRVSSAGCVMRTMMKIWREAHVNKVHVKTFFYPALVKKVFVHV